MTILDVMRTGTPEEIAKMLDAQISDVQDMLCCDVCDHDDDPDWQCYDCWHNWLNNEVDEGLCEEANFNFYRDTPRNRYDYAQKVAQTVIDYMSSVLCLALLDLYGFKAKRLKKMYDMIVFLGGELRRGAMTRAQLFAEADAIRKRATA